MDAQRRLTPRAAEPMCAIGACSASQASRHADDSQARLERADAHIASLRYELQAMEQALLDQPALHAALRGRRLVYVGGRPASNAALRALVAGAGGVFVHHVGLIHDDDRPGGFASLLSGADRVLCPLDLIDPDSLQALRRHCARRGVAWTPLRSSSVTSFIAGVLRADPARRESAPPTPAAPPPARLCVHHG